MEKYITVGILDDHPIVISGFEKQIEQNSSIELCWTANFYQEMIELINKYPVDILILDARVPISPKNPNNYPIFDAIPKILKQYPNTKILVMTMIDRRAFIENVEKVGASGYIIKDDLIAHENLENIILQVANGAIYYSPKAETIIHQAINKNLKLTKRQLQILSARASSPNLNTVQLANELHIAPSTLRNTLADIYVVLGVNNSYAAIEKARMLNLI